MILKLGRDKKVGQGMICNAGDGKVRLQYFQEAGGVLLCISVKSQRTDERLLILTKIVIAPVKIFYARLSSWWRL